MKVKKVALNVRTELYSELVSAAVVLQKRRVSLYGSTRLPTVTAIVNRAIQDEIEFLRGFYNDGRPFRTRTRRLVRGRPRLLPESPAKVSAP